MNVKQSSYIRNDGRTALQMRPFQFVTNPFGCADASVMMTLGNTRVLVSVTLQDGVPPFLRGSNGGWLTAEYSMLPTATRIRTTRDTAFSKPKGRNIEISRLIGRSLRSIIDLSSIGEKTIIVDCDVLQADGGTRTACITAASYALQLGLKKWNESQCFKRVVSAIPIAALSGGVVANELVVDMTQDEDSQAKADINVVVTESGDLIEVQGTAERMPIKPAQLFSLTESLSVAAKAFFQ